MAGTNPVFSGKSTLAVSILVALLAACWLLTGVLPVTAQDESPPEPAQTEETEIEDTTEATGPASEEDSDAGPETDSNSESDSDGDSEEEEEEEEPYASLLVTADAPCNVYVNGVYKGAIESVDEPLEIEVFDPTILLAGSSSDVTGARFDMEEDDALELEENEVREFALPILEAIVDFRALERRQKVWRDLDHGLMWPKRDNATNVTWAKAETFCEELETGGYTNWRLPTIVELESIQAMWSLRPYKITDAILLTSCCPWSDTQPSDTTAYNVDFRYRRRFETHQKLSYSLRALCVRNMLASEVADALILADPKEQKRRLKEKRRRYDERKRRKAERAAKKAAKQQPEENPDGGG